MIKRLSIAVIGVGGIGSTFAYQFDRAGHEVTLVARPGSVRLEQLRRDRGIIQTTGQHAELRVVDALDEQVAYDLVVVTTQAHQVDQLLPALQRSQAACIHFMFNIFEPERLRDAIGPSRCSFGMPFVMAKLHPEGRLESNIISRQKTLHSDQRWVELFNSAHIPSAFETNMLLWLRCHTPLCIAMESISIAGQRRGGGASWAEAMVVARGLHAGFAIVKGLGYRLYPSAKSVINSIPTLVLACMLLLISRNRSFRELLATGVHECRALIDILLVAAATAQPPLPDAQKNVLAMRPT